MPAHRLSALQWLDVKELNAQRLDVKGLNAQQQRRSAKQRRSTKQGAQKDHHSQHQPRDRRGRFSPRRQRR
jgi:hypothetical protein